MKLGLGVAMAPAARARVRRAPNPPSHDAPQREIAKSTSSPIGEPIAGLIKIAAKTLPALAHPAREVFAGGAVIEMSPNRSSILTKHEAPMRLECLDRKGKTAP